jgi:hypothetical protein
MYQDPGAIEHVGPDMYKKSNSLYM